MLYYYLMIYEIVSPFHYSPTSSPPGHRLSNCIYLIFDRQNKLFDLSCARRRRFTVRFDFVCSKLNFVFVQIDKSFPKRILYAFKYFRKLLKKKKKVRRNISRRPWVCRKSEKEREKWKKNILKGETLDAPDDQRSHVDPDSHAVRGACTQF